MDVQKSHLEAFQQRTQMLENEHAPRLKCSLYWVIMSVQRWGTLPGYCMPYCCWGAAGCWGGYPPGAWYCWYIWPEKHRPKESHTDQTNTSFQDASKDAYTQLIPLQTKVGLGASLIYKSLSDAKLVHKKHMWSSDCWTQETKTLNPTQKKHVLIAGLDRYQRHKNHVHTNPPTHEKLTIWNIIFKKRSQRGFMLCLCTQH